MIVEQIVEQYHKLLEEVATHDFYKVDLTNRLNVYVCDSCRHATVTKDVDAGVTPFMHNCEKCGGTAISRMYRVDPNLKHTQEWYRPTLEELLKMSPGMIDHILQGGLAFRNLIINKQIEK